MANRKSTDQESERECMSCLCDMMSTYSSLKVCDGVCSEEEGKDRAVAKWSVAVGLCAIVWLIKSTNNKHVVSREEVISKLCCDVGHRVESCVFIHLIVGHEGANAGKQNVCRWLEVSRLDLVITIG